MRSRWQITRITAGVIASGYRILPSWGIRLCTTQPLADGADAAFEGVS